MNKLFLNLSFILFFGTINTFASEIDESSKSQELDNKRDLWIDVSNGWIYDNWR